MPNIRNIIDSSRFTLEKPHKDLCLKYSYIEAHFVPNIIFKLHFK